MESDMAGQRKDSIITGAFDFNKINRMVRTLPMIAIYNRATDYPDKYVARVLDCNTPKHLIALVDTIEAISVIVPPNITRLPHMAGDDPCIVEVWI